MDESLLKSSHKNQQYNPFKSPPDLQKALQHQLATRVGKDIDDDDKDFHVCPCCENVIQKNEISLNCTDEALLFLGVGYSLYYKLTRYFGMIVFLIFVVSGSGFYFLVTLNCTKQCIYFFGIPIINLQISGVQSAHKADIVNLVAAFAIFACVLYIKSKIRVDIQDLQKRVISPDQYTIMLHNLPQNISQQDVTQWCKQNLQAKPILINFAYNINQLAKAYTNRQELTIKLNKKILNRTITQPNIQQSLLNTEIDQLKQQIRGLDNLIELYREQKITCHKIGTVFITFAQQKIVNQILQKYQHSILKIFINKMLTPFKDPPLLFRTSSVIVSKAPGPKQVIWQNLQYSFLRNVISQILFVIVMIIVLFFSFHFQFLIVELAYKLRHQSQKSKQAVAIIQALAMSVLVVIVNSLLRLLIKLFAYIKRYYSYSSYHSAFCFYYSISYIFNTCFMIYIVHGHFDVNYQHTTLQQQNILIYDIHLIMLANAFSQPLYKVLDFQMWYLLFKRKYIISLSKNNKNPYTQSYVNLAWQGYNIQIADNYQFIYRTVVITTWFAHSAPLGVIFSIVGLFVDYWIGKYLLLRHYKRPQSISKQIAVPMIMSLQLLPLVYICGVLQFTYKVSDSANIFVFMYQFLRYGVTILIILVCILGYLAIYKPNYQTVNPIKYDEVQSMFPYNYQTQNPITKYKGQMKYLYGVLKHGTNYSQQKLIKQFLTLSIKNKDNYAEKQSTILKIKRKKLKKLQTLEMSQQYQNMRQNKQRYSTSSDTSNKNSQSPNI